MVRTVGVFSGSVSCLIVVIIASVATRVVASLVRIPNLHSKRGATLVPSLCHVIVVVIRAAVLGVGALGVGETHHF